MGNGPVDAQPGATKEQQRRGYLDEQAILIRWMQRYPHVDCSLTHGFNYRLWLNDEGTGFEYPDEIWLPWRAGRRCHLEVSFPVRIGDIFDFPYAECRPWLREMVREIGCDRLLWGTDFPVSARRSPETSQECRLLTRVRRRRRSSRTASVHTASPATGSQNIAASS